MPPRLKPSDTRTCTKCKKTKPLDEFSSNPSVSDGKQSRCKKCMAAYMRERRRTHGNARTAINNEARRRKNLEAIIVYLRDHPCVDCGEKDFMVLDFDHVRGKKHTISKILSYSLVAVMREIEKCDVRCANCHRRKTAKEQGWYTYLGRDHDRDARDEMDRLGLKYRKPKPA